MDDIYNILVWHAKNFPQMQPCDAWLLVYENEFGFSDYPYDPSNSLTYLTGEFYRAAQEAPPPLYTEIGNGRVRLNIAALKKEQLAMANELSLASARRRGSSESFRKKLAVLVRAVGDGIFSFSTFEMNEYIEKMQSRGWPPTDHSNLYITAYTPAYRIIDNTYCRLLSCVS